MPSTNAYVGGKAARARAARKGIHVVTDLNKHRPSGGAPIANDLDDMPSDFHSIMVGLEDVERKARIRYRPHLVQRKEVPMDNHGSMIVPITSTTSTDTDTVVGADSGESTAKDGFICNLSEHKLREFTMQSIPVGMNLLSLTHLDLSRNELWTLPSLQEIPNIENLNLSRNWFAELPKSIAHLSKLEYLNASHNMLRSSQSALLIDRNSIDEEEDNNTNHRSILQSLSRLQEIDLTFNQKCGHQKLKDRIQMEVPSVLLKMTVNFPRPEGAFIGASAAERDPSLLRSQLEPWSTTSLRRRLVADFGEEPTSPEEFPRADVMDKLLSLYAEEVEENVQSTYARTVIRAEGILVQEDQRNQLFKALQTWKDNWKHTNLERTSIKAENYMILTSPASWEQLGRKKRQKAETKLRAHQEIWDVAQDIMASVDEEFSTKYTALAVTHNFRGSPHIDRQNVGPFYGMSMGDFDDDTGGVMVECSARVVAHVDTKNKLGKVDGRYPHWVAPYDEEKERFSLIYYQTMGEYQKIGPAIFDNDFNFNKKPI